MADLNDSPQSGADHIPALGQKHRPSGRLDFPKPKGTLNVPRHLQWLIGEPSSDERRALRDICELGHVFSEGRRQFLLVPVTSFILDTLAVFEADRAELEDEPDGEAECGRGPEGSL